jgi:hypothetical protein
VLELVARLGKPIQRDARLTELAARLGLSAGAVREQFQTLAARRRAPASAVSRRGAEAASDARGPGRPPGVREARESPAAKVRLAAWRNLIGAVLIEGALVGELERFLREDAARAPDADLASLAEELVLLARRDGALPAIDGILDAFRAHPAGDWIVPLLEDASVAESPRAAFDGARAKLSELAFQELVAEHRAALPALTPGQTAEREAELELLYRRLRERVARPGESTHPSTASGATARSTAH